MLVLAFALGFFVASFIFIMRGERLAKKGAFFFYKNKSLFELKREVEEELNDLLTEIRMEREALEKIKKEAELLADRLESLIYTVDKGGSRYH